MQGFKKVTVLGAGVMGSGIAAHLAGAGIDVFLLDIVPPDGKSPRNSFAENGKANALKAKPAAFFTKKDADRIRIGNFDDDLKEAAKTDLIIEVVKEDLAVKQALFKKLEPLIDDNGAHTIVASNTSGLPIAKMTEGRSASFKKRFLVTHFFDPVRYMRLLEIIVGPETDPKVSADVARFCQDVLGKGIVHGKDTVNFVANRIGVFGMMSLIHEAVQNHYTVEEVDATFGTPLGRPKSAAFRTADIVGLDTLVHVAQNCYDNLPNDPERETFRVPAVLTKMVEQKMLGDKTKGGFSKKTKDGILTLDLEKFEYRPQQKAKFPSIGAVKGITDVKARVKAMLTAAPDRASDLGRKVTYTTLAYASHRVGEIADDIVNIDRAMRWGFAWDLGPFETWDAVGVKEGLAEMDRLGIVPAKWVREMVAAGKTSFYAEETGPGTTDKYYDVKGKNLVVVPEAPHHLQLKQQKKIFGNDGATLWDIGDRVAALEFHTKMNAIDADVIEMLQKSIDEAEKNFDGLVIANEAKDAFCAGANIFLVVMAASQGNFKDIEQMVTQLHAGMKRMRYASIPVVTAPFGLALGGGCEVSMQGAAARAHAELYMGLVEVGVGVIPAGGGCKEMLARALGHLPDDVDPFPFVKNIFLNLGMGKVSFSAEIAREMGFLRESDAITFNRDFLIYDAKQTALGLSRAGYRAPRARTFKLPGTSGYATIRSTLQMMHEAHQISEHDVKVGSKLAWVLCGGNTPTSQRVTEDYILELEREAFVSLCGETKTQERMQYMLMNNKPLRN